MMYLPKMFAHASLILMLVKITFANLLLTTLVIISNLLSLYTCPSKSKEKPCMGKVYRLGQYTFFSLYGQITHSYLINFYSAKKK